MIGARHVLGVEHLRDVLRAVGVPGLDLEQDHLLGARLVALGPEAREQRGIVLHHAGAAPQLHAPALRVVHDEDEGLGVLGQVAGGDVLAVALEVGEAQRVLVEDAQEARRAAAMLHVGLAVGAGGGEIERAHLGQEAGEIGRDGRAPAAFRLHLGVVPREPRLAWMALTAGVKATSLEGRVMASSIAAAAGGHVGRVRQRQHENSSLSR